MKIKETKSAGGVVLNTKGQVLVVSQRSTSWSLPKGHIEKDESSLEAAKREILEEAGLKKLKFIRKLGSYKRFQLPLAGKEEASEVKTITMFLFKTDEEILQPQDQQNPEARWVDKEKVANLLTHPKDKEFFLKIINKI